MRILSNVRLVLAAAIAALPSPSLVHAATPPVDRTWSNEFATPAFDHDVNCAVRWRGGLVVGGWFTLAGIVPAWNIAWWDGSRWRDLGGGVDGPVRCLAVVDDTLLVGGDFSHAGGASMPGIARWTGARWVPMGEGLGGDYSAGVHALAMYRDTLVAVGSFTHSGPTWMYGAAWWDGETWHPVGRGFDRAGVDLAAVYRDRLFVAGSFTGVEGLPANGLASWDGARWSPVPWQVSPLYTAWNEISALAVAHDRLYVGGFFDHADTVAADHLATWDGSAWSAVRPTSGYSSTGYGVTALAVHADSLIVGTSYGGLSRWDGVRWTYLYSNLDAGYITGVLADDAGSVVTGWVQAHRPGTAEPLGYEVLVNTGGDWGALQTWSNTMHGFARGGAVWDLVRYGPDIVAAGSFESVADGSHWEPVDYLARWDGSAWRAFPNWPIAHGGVNGVAVTGDTLIAVGSFFGRTGTYDVPGYRFDGAHWTQLDTLSSSLRCPTRYRGALYMGASPSMGNRLQTGGVYRLDGTHWSKVADISAPYNNPTVFAMAVHDDRLVVGGSFDHINGVATTNVAAWDGVTWTPFGELPEGSSGPPVLDFAELDTTLYVAGSFGQSSEAVMRWDGIAWQATGLPSGVAMAVTPFDGHLYTVVSSSRPGTPVQGLARWDGTGWTSVATPNEFVESLFPDGESLWLGGQFTQIDDLPSSCIAQWKSSTAPLGVGVALSSGVPNPSRGAVDFSYAVSTAGIVTITVSDASGRHIATLDSGQRSAGEHSVHWDGRGEGGRRLPAGLFFVRLVLPGGEIAARKVVLLP